MQGSFPNPLARGVTRQSKFGHGGPTSERAEIAISGDGDGGGAARRTGAGNASPKQMVHLSLNRAVFFGDERTGEERPRGGGVTFGVRPTTSIHGESNHSEILH